MQFELAPNEDGEDIETLPSGEAGTEEVEEEGDRLDEGDCGDDDGTGVHLLKVIHLFKPKNESC